MKWTLIREKNLGTAVPTVIAVVVAMAFMVTVGVVLTATKLTWVAMRRRSRRKHSLSNLYMLPEGYVDFNSRVVTLKTGTDN